MKTFLFTMALVLIGFAAPAFANDKVSTGTFSNKAVSGYDTVAYFTQGDAVEGSSDYSSQYNGAKWLFSTAENKAKFDANPDKYAPQYGGYCAWAVAQGYTASSDPEQWAIVDGKLYLNYNADIKAKWDKDRSGFITSANTNWPSVIN